MKTTASDWVSTDKESCIADLTRLGLEDATQYQMDLIADCAAKGDARWNGITADEMRVALVALQGGAK